MTKNAKNMFFLPETPGKRQNGLIFTSQTEFGGSGSIGGGFRSIGCTVQEIPPVYPRGGQFLKGGMGQIKIPDKSGFLGFLMC